MKMAYFHSNDGFSARSRANLNSCGVHVTGDASKRRRPSLNGAIRAAWQHPAGGAIQGSMAGFSRPA